MILCLRRLRRQQRERDMGKENELISRYRAKMVGDAFKEIFK